MARHVLNQTLGNDMETNETVFSHALRKLLKGATTLDSVAKEAGDISYAATIGNKDLLLKCLEDKDKHDDINKVDENGKTALFMAVMNNHEDIVDILLKHRALQNITSETGETYSSPLHTVQSSTIASTLLKSGGDVNAVNERGQTPIHRVIQMELEVVVNTFIDKGANVNLPDNEGMTPLHTACDSECNNSILNIMNSLVKAGASVNATDNYGRSPLHYIGNSTKAKKGIELLLSMGADLQLRDFQGQLPIHDCVNKLHIQETGEILDILQLYCPSPLAANMKDANGKTALHQLVVDSDIHTIEQMLILGGDVNQRDNFGKSPLHYVSDSKGQVSNNVVNVLVKHGAVLDLKDEWGRTALLNFVDQEQVVCVDQILMNGTDVNHADNCGITALHIACYRDSPILVEKLLDKGANINATDANETTPLHAAAYSGSNNSVKILVQKGADITKRDNLNSSAQEIAFKKGHEEILKIVNPDENQRISPFVQFSSGSTNLLSLDTVQTMLQERSFKHTKENVEEFVSDILQTPYIGRGADDDEAKEIQSVVENVIQSLASKIGEEDSRFRCTVLHAGSSSEGTKTKSPDEFDFMLCLEEFSKFCKPMSREADTDVQTKIEVPPIFKSRDSDPTSTSTIDERFKTHPDIQPADVPVSISDYVYMVLEQTSEAQRYIDFIGGCEMPVYKMYHGFSMLVAKVLFSMEFPKDPRLIPIEVTLDPALRFLWRGRSHKYMEIDIDLVPALELPKWPEKSRKDSPLLTGDMLRLPSLAVPKMTSGLNEDLWRCSLALIETAIFRNLRPKIRNSYIACKAFVSSAILPQVSFGSYDEEIQIYKDLYGSFDDDEDVQLHESAESLIPSYLIKMTFLSLLEERIERSGIRTVFDFIQNNPLDQELVNEPSVLTPTKTIANDLNEIKQTEDALTVLNETIQAHESEKKIIDEKAILCEERLRENNKPVSIPDLTEPTLMRNDGNETDDEYVKNAKSYYGPAEKMFIVERSLDFDIELVRDVFRKCEDNIRRKFVPSVFNHRHNVLGGKLMSGDVEKVLVFFEIINALLSENE